MAKDTQYTEAVGRRKTATARVRITPAKQDSVIVNEKDLSVYFPLAEAQQIIFAPLKVAGAKFTVTAKVQGGGPTAQAEAIRHGLSRALNTYNPELRKELKVLGFLKRDPRAKERKKFGLKAARRRPQWSKR